MVLTPYGVDGPQASGLPPKPEAQGLQEEQQQSQLRCRCILGHCSFGHHHPQQSLRGSIGHARNHERRRVMVRSTSVIWGTLLVCAAGPLDTGQDIITYLFYLFLNFLLTFIMILLHLAYPTKTLATAIIKSAPWPLRGEPHAIHRTRVKRYKIPVRNHQTKSKTSGATI